jgi:hypothetical protein
MLILLLPLWANTVNGKTTKQVVKSLANEWVKGVRDIKKILLT